MNELTAIIVDDELFGRENLKKIIETYCPEVIVLGCADSVVNALKMVTVHRPDVVFLDITMPVLDGFDFLKEFDERDFMVVFFSAHDEFGINAVKAGAVDYLLKPINIKELKQTVKKLLSLKSKNSETVAEPVQETIQETDKLVLPATHGFDILIFDDIIRLEADSCYTKVILTSGVIKLISHTLKDFEDKLPEKQFYRIHKSHLINLKYIKAYSNISGYHVTMADDSRIEISRRKAPEFIQKIKAALNTL